MAKGRAAAVRGRRGEEKRREKSAQQPEDQPEQDHPSSQAIISHIITFGTRVALFTCMITEARDRYVQVYARTMQQYSSWSWSWSWPWSALYLALVKRPERCFEAFFSSFSDWLSASRPLGPEDDDAILAESLA